MKNHQYGIKSLIFLVIGFMVTVGTYNAIVISSSSDITGHTTIKRLDEMYGNIKVGRTVANSSKWEKIQIPTKQIESTPKVTSAETTSNIISEASIQESLELKLAEVVNPKKWNKSLKPSQFSGNLETNNGVIENMTISLPGIESISASFTELSGNVFQYEYEGNLYSGLMYQVDQSAYMVTLTNGPLEGTRLRFTSDSNQIDAQEYLANAHNVEVGNFGEEIDQSPSQEPNLNNTVSTDVATFNFGSKI